MTCRVTGFIKFGHRGNDVNICIIYHACGRPCAVGVRPYPHDLFVQHVSGELWFSLSVSSLPCFS